MESSNIYASCDWNLHFDRHADAAKKKKKKKKVMPVRKNHKWLVCAGYVQVL